MAIADPKTYAKPKAVDDDEDDVQTQLANLQAQVQALLQAQTTSSSGLSEDRLEKILLKVAETTAAANERAANPSNKVHPHISVYSYPEGDIARPKPKLACETLWVGYPEMEDNLTPEEILLLNEIQPGDYMFTRADLSRTPMSVVGDVDNAGRLSRKSITFACRGEWSLNLPSKVDQLRSAMGKLTREQELERDLAALRAQLAGASA
jgi:hypothetical protein